LKLNTKPTGQPVGFVVEKSARTTQRVIYLLYWWYMTKARLLFAVLLVLAAFALLVFFRVIQNPFIRQSHIPVPLSKQEFLDSVASSPVSDQSDAAKKQFADELSKQTQSTPEQRSIEQQMKAEFISSFRSSSN